MPIPGIDSDAFLQFFQNPDGQRGILDMFNMFSGGAVERMAIFALNVMPYISASIIVQLMGAVYPPWEKLRKEGGESGRKQLNQYTRYLTVVLALFQSFGIAVGLNAQPGLVDDPGLFFIVSTVTTLTGGTMFLMWLGEQVTARGVGNGISLIIFAGIVAVLPGTIARLFGLAQQGQMSRLRPAVHRRHGDRRRGLHRLHGARPAPAADPVSQAPGRQPHGRGRALVPAAEGQHRRRHPADLRLVAADAADHGRADDRQRRTCRRGWTGCRWSTGQLQHGQPLFMVLYGALIIFFCFFYTSIAFNPEDTAENLRKYGGFLPGIRPGKRTAEYLDYVLTRLTVIGAAYITAVCLLPEIAGRQLRHGLYLGGTSILIVVSVTMDTVAQIQSHLLAHQYEGLIKKAKLRGRGRTPRQGRHRAGPALRPAGEGRR